VVVRQFTDRRGAHYVFDPKLHCGASGIGTFCIVGPGHYGDHWDGTRSWPQEAPSELDRYLDEGQPMSRPLTDAESFAVYLELK
jgi:hypothetical protein